MFCAFGHTPRSTAVTWNHDLVASILLSDSERQKRNSEFLLYLVLFDKHYCRAVLILAGIFDLVLVFILRQKCLIVLVTF